MIAVFLEELSQTENTVVHSEICQIDSCTVNLSKSGQNTAGIILVVERIQ